MLYGRFVGSWDVRSVDMDQEGQRRDRSGEIAAASGTSHGSWGGRAVQDVLYPIGSTPGQFGTTLRSYDEKADVWHVSWMAPAGGEFIHLIGREAHGRIVQTGWGPDVGRREKWIFSDITDQSLLWQGMVSTDDGETWRLVQEMRATRRQDPSSNCRD